MIVVSTNSAPWRGAKKIAPGKRSAARGRESKLCALEGRGKKLTHVFFSPYRGCHQGTPLPWAGLRLARAIVRPSSGGLHVAARPAAGTSLQGARTISLLTKGV